MPNIESVAQLTFSDLLAKPGVVLALPKFKAHAGVPTNTGLIAGVCMPDGDGPGMPKIVMIDFHRGNKSWCLVIEHSIQKRNEYRAGILPEIVQYFEAEVGVELPAIKVIDYGTGIYPASCRFQSENPWAFRDGSTYKVTDKHGHERTLIANVKNGRTLITYLDESHPIAGPFDPAVVFGFPEWETLTQVAAK